jgi:hypothetical protein
MSATIENIQAMLKPMGWVAMYFGMNPADWHRFYEGLRELAPRDADEMYLIVLDLSQEEWRPVWNVWKQIRLSDPDNAYKIWMHYRAVGITGQNEQKLLTQVYKPFKAKLKGIISRWSIQQDSES